uniref:CSP5 n=1 Tax=Hycleus cichorii TaxID=1270216 RepID=A0A2U9NK51_9CUCU|nr:CSP5 [Hycleus cichorii]
MVVTRTGWITVTTITTLFVAITTAQQKPYASRYDHLDVTTILNNRRMVTYYANCLLSKGPCPPQGLELKHILPEALETNCARCTTKQKTAAYRSVKRLQKEYPKIWDQLTAVWDPDGFYIKRFEATFENGQIIDNDLQTQPSASAAPTVLSNRFGDDTAEATNDIATNLSPSTATTTSSTTSSTPTKTAASTTTNRPSTNNVVVKPTQRQPTGANSQPTVSFGGNAVVNGIVRSLTDLSVRVVQTGTKLADAVINAVIRPPVVN